MSAFVALLLWQILAKGAASGVDIASGGGRAAASCTRVGGGGAACPAVREEVLLQVQRLQRHSAMVLNATDDGSGAGFCCLSSGASQDMCGDCLSMASADAWCGRGRLSCEYFCRGSWCASAPLVTEHNAPPEEAIKRSRCCLVAKNDADACGTCWPGSFAQVSSWCARSEANCRACSGGKGSWCEADAAPVEPVTPPPPETEAPTTASPTAPTKPPTPEATPGPTTAAPGAPAPGAAGCCFSAADPSNMCGTCHKSAFAGPGKWCAESEENCRTCSGSWCTGGPTRAPVEPTTSAPLPTEPLPTEESTATPTTTEVPPSTSRETSRPATPTPAPSPQPPAPSPEPPASSEWIKGTWTTGYWDCCKPSCAWAGKGNVDKPTLACDAKTGERLFDANVRSVCDGGTAAACADNAPFMVNQGLSMGFSAVAVSGSHSLSGDDNCGQCYELKFVDQIHPKGNWGGSHPDLVGKSMVVQVTNIGYDVNGEHSFDIQIPGAGQGIFTNGCTAQFSGYSSGDFDCDNNYGGCSERSGCARLPEELQKPCEWRYDWYRWFAEGGQTNNPYVHFRRVQCPSELTEISGSVPSDDEAFPKVDVNSYA